MGRHGWNSGARRWRLTALLGVGVAALALVLTLSTLPDGKGSTEGTTPDGAKPHGTPSVPAGKPDPELGWGFTHTKNSADEGEQPAIERAGKLLSATPMPQLQHLMGWGSDNPEPSPGAYDFEAMDRRIDFIRASGGTPVVTLCCAPDWMKGGEAGKDKIRWDQIEVAPVRAHYKDFAKLAAVVAKRYPDVRHFVVWNEFKGFWNSAEGRWDYEGYTELYNLVYKELKKVDEDIQVGGPYLVMDSLNPRQDEGASNELKGPWGSADQRVLDAFEYWNEKKAGADFVVVDGSSYTVDDELVPDEFKATDKLTAVGKWVREKSGGLPLWWAEYYVEPGDDDDDRDGWTEPHRLAVQASGMMAMAKGGATTGFYWNPQKKGTKCAGCLWRSTELADGGSELPMLGLVARFGKEFGPGTEYEKVAIAADDVPNVRVLADDKAVLVVNTLDREIDAKIDGKRFTMPGYGVKWLER
ncbi:GH39 family glycosyl hydrolase [Streptomyces sp. NBC_01304]|uniref:GH39 family glycosyl hydrolase n=1 Tax=Streptomyces sp. NBC_01304 TaxID=2903818 RepID=UPI002E15781A|nr:xylan 1,4-beta-xylosidase [Streptomyces sp. NBC_01304]